MKILYLVLTTRHSRSRQEVLKDTWLKDKSYLFYSDEEGPNTVKITDDHTYRSAEEKNVGIINYLIKNPLDYDWYMFIDDDTFVFTKRLENALAHANPELVYGQILKWGDCPENPIFSIYGRDFQYPSGGAGYVISKELLVTIKQFRMYGSGYSDVTVGLNLKDQNVKCSDLRGMHSQAPSFYPNIDIKQQITFHYIKERKDVETLYRIYS